MGECTNGELRDLLPDLVNGQLDANTVRAVEAHAASCAECAAELNLLRSLRPVLMRAPGVDAAQIAAAVNARVPTPSREPMRNGRGAAQRRWGFAIAAVALLAVSGVIYTEFAREKSVTPDVAVVQPPIAMAPESAAPITVPAPAPAIPPRTSTPAPAPQQRVAVASGVLDNLSDLSDDDVRTLTASLDQLSSVPDALPGSDVDPLGASLEDSAAGGR